MLMLPIALILFSLIFIIMIFSSAFGAIAEGGRVVYDNKEFESYAIEKYYEEFGDSGDAFEDNLLIAFLTNEEADGFYTIAIVGDNLEWEISDMFGNEYTEFGIAIMNSIDPDDYTHSLSSGLARAMSRMADEVESKGYPSNFQEEFSHEDSPPSHLVNLSPMSLNEKTVNRALEDFTEKTGIPAVIVVDSMEAVFGKGLTGDDILAIFVALLIIAFAVFLIFKAVNNKNKKEEEEEPYNRYAKD